jgi:hypothetical protein
MGHKLGKDQHVTSGALHPLQRNVNIHNLWRVLQL